jgi:hypothetical protein
MKRNFEIKTVFISAAILSVTAAFAVICNDDARDVGTSPPTGCEVNVSYQCVSTCHFDMYFDASNHTNTMTIKEKKAGTTPPTNKAFIPNKVNVWAVPVAGTCSGNTVPPSRDASACICGNLIADPAHGTQKTVDSGYLVVCGS